MSKCVSSKTNSFSLCDRRTNRHLPAQTNQRCLILFSFRFNSLQCRSLLYFYRFADDWCHDLRFYLGLALFLAGMAINLQSDGILRALSRQKEKQKASTRAHYPRYQIPRGGLFEYCSAPHYFGEIVEWTGFCLACNGSIASWSFCIFTISNLLPRGMAQHVWYQSYFNGASSSSAQQDGTQLYPSHRKAVIPFVW